MKQSILKHSLTVAAAAGTVAFAVSFSAISLWSSERASIMIEDRRGLLFAAPASLQPAAYEPVAIARIANPADPALIQWLTVWAGESHASAGDDLRRDEREAADLMDLLKRTTLGGQAAFQIAQALFDDGIAADQTLSGWFFDTYVDKTESELAHLNRSDPRAKPLVQLLWSSESYAGGVGEWPERQKIYGALIDREEPDSPQCYRARLKHADVLALNRRAADSLREMAALAIDVDRGIFPFAKQKDVAEVYWLAFLRAGRDDDGLAYLRGLVAKAKGTSDEGPFEAQLTRALAECGKLDDAKAELAKWAVQFGPTASQAVRDDLNMRINEAEHASPSFFKAHVRASTKPTNPGFPP